MTASGSFLSGSLVDGSDGLRPFRPVYRQAWPYARRSEGLSSIEKTENVDSLEVTMVGEAGLGKV